MAIIFLQSKVQRFFSFSAITMANTSNQVSNPSSVDAHSVQPYTPNAQSQVFDNTSNASDTGKVGALMNGSQAPDGTPADDRTITDAHTLGQPTENLTVSRDQGLSRTRKLALPMFLTY